MNMPSLLELAESGAHFGHHRSLTYPKAKKFIYAVQKNVALINLEETQHGLEGANKAFHEYKEAGRRIVFVGTRRAIRPIVQQVAESVGAPYITERWFGGMLTNFDVIAGTIKRMNELAQYLEGSEAAALTKKDRLRLTNKLERYQRFLGGVSELKGLPELLILASATEDKIAVAEAHQLGIPIIAITDTDINPELINYPVPANDDAPKAVELILNTIVSAIESTKTTKKTATEIEEVSEEVPAEKPAKKAAPTKKVKDETPEVKATPKAKVAKASSATAKKAVKPKK